MNSDPDFDLETFVEQFFTSHGAAIEKEGPGLNILAPDALAEQIGMPNFCSLKIGDGQPGDYAINYGSPLLEKITTTACDTIPFIKLHLDFHYIKSQGFQRAIENQFRFYNGIVALENSAEVQTDYIVLACLYLAQSDEQKEGLIFLGFNLETGAPADAVETVLDAVGKRYEPGGLNLEFDREKRDKVMQWIALRAPGMIEKQIEAFRSSMNRRYLRDVTNLTEYYTELRQEMEKALKRPGLSAELIAERKDKIDLIPEETAKKKADLFKKYSITVTLDLSAVMLIRTPAVKLYCSASVGRRKKSVTLFYNPILKALDPLVCNKCNEGIFDVHFNNQFHPVCSRCALASVSNGL